MTVLNGKKLFGAGRAFASLNTTMPTPIRFTVVQDMSLTMKRDVKMLYGENQLAEDLSSATLDITGKVTTGGSSARVVSDLFFGANITSPGTMQSDKEVQTVSASDASPDPSNITAAHVPFVMDLGVVDVATGVRMVQVANGEEVAGESYSLVGSTGKYHFADEDAGTQKEISYLYTESGSAGYKMSLANVKQGRVGGFTAALVFPWQNVAGVEEQDVFTLTSCLATDYEMTTKSGDYGKPPFGFSVACDSTGSLGSAAFAEMS